MGVSISALALAIVLQGPGDGWAFVHDTGKVKTLYWELFDTTEVWLRLIPEGGADRRVSWCARWRSRSP